MELHLELAQVRERRGDVGGAVAALQQILNVDACHEPAANELMLVFARHGRRPDALRVYQRLEEALRNELAVEPSDNVQETRRQIANGEITGSVRRSAEPDRATAPPDRTADADVDARTQANTGEPTDELLRASDPAAPFQPGYPFPSPALLVGRQREQLWIQQVLDRGRTEGRTYVIGAPAGTGKSTLAGRLVQAARERGFLCLAGGTFYQESPIPYGPIRDALADYLLSRTPEQIRTELGDVGVDLVPIVPELHYHLNLPDVGPGTSLDPAGSWVPFTAHYDCSQPDSQWCSAWKIFTPSTGQPWMRSTTWLGRLGGCR